METIVKIFFRPTRILYVLLAILLLTTNSTRLFAQYQFECVPPIDAPTPETVTCLYNNIYSNPDRYKLQENFIPTSTQAVKTFTVNLIILQNSTVVGSKGNFENTPADIAMLNAIVDNANIMLSNVQAPALPQTCYCGTSCHVQDTRLRLDIGAINFHYSPTLYGSNDHTALRNTYGVNVDSEINLFFRGDFIGTGAVGGNNWYLASPTNMDLLQEIVYKNYNQTRCALIIK